MDATYKSASVFKQSTKGALFFEVGVIPFQGLLNILKKIVHAALTKVSCLTKTMQKKNC